MKKYLKSIVRHGLTAAAGALAVSHPEIAAVLYALSQAWSLVEKKKQVN